MLPFNILIDIDRKSTTPVYIQVSNGLIKLVREGKITPGTFLPPTRIMAGVMNIHRKTVVNAYDELTAQGWIEALHRRGFRVVPDLPVVKPRSFHPRNNFIMPPERHADILPMPVLPRPGVVAGYAEGAIVIDDGFPDPALTPHELFLQEYRRLLNSDLAGRIAVQKDAGGVPRLRQSATEFLNQTRGLNITPDQLMITRGAQMAIYTAAALLIKPGDNVLVGEPSYFMADDIFRQMGGVIHRVPVDHDGMDVTKLEDMLKTRQFKLLYVIPHHHHPTTVTMSMSRRMQLLNLIKQYRLWVIEDDYDYDFHYRNSPILPLASADHEGQIIYIGSFTKLLGTSFRIGYLVAGKYFVDQAIKFRRFFDIRGDFMMESALASLIDNGALGRHIKRTRKIYHARLEAAARLITDAFPETITFDKPQGGLALWLRFDERYPLGGILARSPSMQLHLNGSAYFEGHNTNYNALRFGFSSLPTDQLEKAVGILRKVVSSDNF